ncbi:YbhB/YbcL family Raf kinase inhibitor-like protein [Halobacterium zhouii]|uniref:YbhB/YbcL family Raf kinase inhibitor-like protein n=1 Tax=Halobacterium zhouii TaxID=2902624 RepID=UPI001E487CE5|nr:YbhB/YbcL family Raf kinase inhibitor-like protein [Halobacterium zhouii]
MTDLILRSPAFEDGGRIPDRYGYTEENINPPLTIEGVPAESASLVLIVDSPNPRSSSKDVWNHWLVWDIPPTLEEIPEGWDPEQATEGQNDFGEHGYGGPNPTGQEQTYRFRLYALETTLGLPSVTEKEELVDAVVGNIIDKTRLEGTAAP